MAWYSKFWVKVCLLVVVVGSPIMAYAYSKLSQPTAGPKVFITSSPLIFSMELQKANFQYGENITIKFRLENIGNKTITIRRVDPPCWHFGYMETSYYGVHAPD